MDVDAALRALATTAGAQFTDNMRRWSAAAQRLDLSHVLSRHRRAAKAAKEQAAGAGDGGKACAFPEGGEGADAAAAAAAMKEQQEKAAAGAGEAAAAPPPAGECSAEGGIGACSADERAGGNCGLNGSPEADSPEAGSSEAEGEAEGGGKPSLGAALGAAGEALRAAVGGAGAAAAAALPGKKGRRRQGARAHVPLFDPTAKPLPVAPSFSVFCLWVALRAGLACVDSRLLSPGSGEAPGRPRRAPGRS
jgi:hypothetical protein